VYLVLFLFSLLVLLLLFLFFFFLSPFSCFSLPFFFFLFFFFLFSFFLFFFFLPAISPFFLQLENASFLIWLFLSQFARLNEASPPTSTRLDRPLSPPLFLFRREVRRFLHPERAASFHLPFFLPPFICRLLSLSLFLRMLRCSTDAEAPTRPPPPQPRDEIDIPALLFPFRPQDDATPLPLFFPPKKVGISLAPPLPFFPPPTLHIEGPVCLWLLVNTYCVGHCAVPPSPVCPFFFFFQPKCLLFIDESLLLIK